MHIKGASSLLPTRFGDFSFCGHFAGELSANGVSLQGRAVRSFPRAEPAVNSTGFRGRMDGVRDVAAGQADRVRESRGGVGLLIVAEGDRPVLHEVDEGGAEVFRAEVLRRQLKVTFGAGDALDVGLDGLWREIVEGRILDHAVANGRHVRVLCELTWNLRRILRKQQPDSKGWTRN